MDQESNHDSEKKSRLFNPVAYIPLAFLFSFIFPGVLFALNAGRLYGPKSRNRLLILFATTGAALIAVLLIFFEKTSGSARIGFLGLNIAVGGLLYTFQLPKYREYKSAGAKPRSLFVPILIAVAAVAILVSPAIISDVLALGQPAVAQYDDHANRIAYDASIALDEVQRIAIQLRHTNLFKDDSGFQFRLKNEEEQYLLIIPFKQSALGKSETNDFTNQLAYYINQNGGLRKTVKVKATVGRE